MSGYTKLHGSIIHSTVWREAHYIRIVWVTMLAMANKDGVVEAAVPGLADVSRVTLSECVESLEKFMSPDRYSRTTDHEGRRIEKVDGGWRLLNYEKHREKLSVEDIRAKNRERQKRWRERQKALQEGENNAPVTLCDADNDIQRQRQRKKETSEKAECVWKHHLSWWQKVKGKGPAPKRSDKRLAMIKARLEDGFEVDQLCKALDGMWTKQHNLEGNYLSLDLVMRNPSQVELYEGFASVPSRQNDPRLRDGSQEILAMMDRLEGKA